MAEEEENKNSKTKEEYRRGILLFLRFSGWVAGPVVAGALIGTWLDGKYGTSPWLFLASIGFAFIVSMIGLIKESVKEYKKIDEENHQKRKNRDQNKDDNAQK